MSKRIRRFAFTERLFRLGVIVILIGRDMIAVRSNLTRQYLTMKLSLRFFHITDSKRHRKLVQNELEPLSKEMPITEAEATIIKPHEGDRRIEAHAHLAVPGPDIRVSATDYTVEAVLRKLGRSIRDVWKHRLGKRESSVPHLRLAPSRVR